MKKSNIKRWKKWLAVGLVMVWAGMIFIMSNLPADASNAQSNVAVNLVERVFNLSVETQPELVSCLTTIVRKCAHAIEYLVLGVLLLNMMRQFWPQKWTKYWYIAIIVAVAYAVIDELHQTLVPGRSCELRDMLIDTVAASVGVGMVMVVRWTRRRFHYRSSP